MSNRGTNVSFLCSQNLERDLLVFNTVEYSCTAISCKPASVLLARPDRHLYSCGSASSSCLFGLDEATKAFEMRLERTDDVKSGIASSGFDDCLSSGRKGLYGSGCLTRADVKDGMSV